MVAWEEDDLTTSKLRGFDLEKLSTFLDFRDRIFSRITLEAYGKTIDYFQSREEFLYAFRDGVAGHRNLWNSGILHRNISVNNILVGQPYAKVGNRGVLIDLNMAIRLDRTDTLASVDFRTGTRAFQSVSVLLSVNKAADQALSHDHLDDLESFFYVFCWITLGYDGPNKPIIDNRQPNILKQWDQNDAVAAANSRGLMMACLCEKVTPYFGPIFQKLLVNMHSFYWPHISLKMKQMNDATIPRKHLLDLIKSAKADYATVLSFIDQAVIALESDNAQCATPAEVPTPATPTRNQQPPDLGASSPAPTPSHSGSSLKRRADDPGMIDSSPKSKKQKQKRHSRISSSFSLPTVER